MKDLTLLVMAAGMGSRYGGLKQLDGVGPNNESIIDYSVYDAIKYGVNKIVFIIRKDFEEQFRSKISNKYIDKIHIKYAFQDIYDIPARFNCPIDREKPWGTGHAILSAKDQINEPFIVINGDDYYGYDSFKVIVDYYYKNAGAQFCMVAFQLDKTLSSIGPVTRGVCTVKNNKLDTITEIEKIEKYRNTISSTSKIVLNGNEPASMNMWGFTPEIFSYLESGFSNFLLAEGNNY